MGEIIGMQNKRNDKGKVAMETRISKTIKRI